MNNSTFRHALISLSHPVSVAAILIVLLNDHWWRCVAPSWFTGKIGDFAWLIFAPFLFAALLAWLAPRREKLVGYAAIVGVGLIFGLAKTVPAFHALTIGVLEFLTGWPNVLRLDPTDLLSLPALLIAWWIWAQSATRSLRLPQRGWVLLPLAVLATMADSAQPNPGIACVQQVDGQILASDVYYGNGTYVSRDGGLSWLPDANKTSTNECRGSSQEMISPQDPLIHFRVNGRQIERSDDGGYTWQIEYALQDMTDAQQVYAGQNEGGNPAMISGGLVAVIDATSGNLIVSAGHQGVLVRTPAGAWQAIGVGAYQPIDLHQPATVVSLLAGEILAALVVFALAIGIMAPGKLSLKVRLLLIFSWLTMGGAIVVRIMFLEPGSYSQLGSQFFVYGVVSAGLLAAVVAAIRLNALFRFNPTAIWATLGLSTLAALFFLMPFIVWSQNGIPFYVTALGYAGVLVVATCLVGRRYLRRYAVVAPTT